MDLVHVVRQIDFLGEGEATCGAFERALLEVDIAMVATQMLRVGE